MGRHLCNCPRHGDYMEFGPDYACPDCAEEKNMTESKTMIAKEWLSVKKEDIGNLMDILDVLTTSSDSYVHNADAIARALVIALWEESKHDTDSVTASLVQIEDNVYQVSVMCIGNNSNVFTTWGHEDALTAERDSLKSDPKHPVHNMVSMGDIYNRAAPYVGGKG